MNNEQEIIELGIVGIKNMGEFDSQTSYEKLNVVTYNGSSYCAIKNTTGNLPTDTDYWQLYAAKGSTGATGATGATGPQGPQGVPGEPSGTPLAAASTSDMTDTTKVYVNTTDGKWYYYDGDSWEIGGTYQSTEIGNNSISPLNLETDLQKQIKYNIPEYTLTDGSYISTYGTIITGQYSTDYSYSSPIEFKKGQTVYCNAAGSTGVAILSKCDSEGNNRSCLVAGTGTTEAPYKYTAEFDMYIIICSLKTKLNSVIISSNILTGEDLPKYLDLKTDSNDVTIISDSDISDYTSDKYVAYATGNLNGLNGLKASDYIEIKENNRMKLECVKNLVNNADSRGLAFYDKDKFFISGVQYTVSKELTFTSPANAKYIRYTIPSEQHILYYTSLKSYINDNIIEDYKDLFKSFPHVGIIGDSLASGESAYKDGSTTKYVDIFEHSWGQYMARMSGNTYYNFSRGGLSSRSWLTNSRGYPLASDGDHDCEAYIIALGENDWRIENYLGSSADINLSDYTQNADTFYGNYAGIIQRMKTICPKAKFFLVTMPTTGATKQSFNVAIRYMATIFTNVYVLDLENDYLGYFSSGSFINGNSRGSHYNAVAYNYIAQLFMLWLSKIMNENISDFRQIEFINTNYEWSD